MALTVQVNKIVENSTNPLLSIAPNWKRVLVGDIADILNGYAFESSLFSSEKGFPLIRIRDVGTDKTECYYQGQYENEYIVSPGDLLIGMDGDFKSARWRGQQALLNQRVCKISLKTKNYEEKFLDFVLQPYLNVINNFTSSVTVKHLSSRSIAEIPLPLPPLNEQKRIVTKMEELFSELDEGIAALKKAKAELKRYRQSVLKAAFEGEISKKWRENQLGLKKVSLDEIQLQRMTRQMNPKNQKNKITFEEWKKKYILPIQSQQNESITTPSNWLCVNLGEVFDVYVGATPDRSKKQYWHGDIPWVSSGEVAFCSIYETKEKITSEGFENSSTKIHPKGTLLLGMIGEGKTRGQVAILEIAACNNQNSAAIRVSEVNQSSRYFYYYLSFIYEKNRKIGSGNNQKALNKERVQMIPILLPPTAEQETIVSTLDSIFSDVAKIEEMIAYTTTQSERLRQSILKKAFEGKLVSQDPKDESAEILLQKIKQEKIQSKEKKRRR